MLCKFTVVQLVPVLRHLVKLHLFIVTLIKQILSFQPSRRFSFIYIFYVPRKRFKILPSNKSAKDGISFLLFIIFHQKFILIIKTGCLMNSKEIKNQSLFQTIFLCQFGGKLSFFQCVPNLHCLVKLNFVILTLLQHLHLFQPSTRFSFISVF